MKFEAKDGEDTYTVSCFGGAVEFRCDLLDKPYKSFDALESAVKAKKLELRKNFSNTQAFLVDRGSKSLKPVTITSLDGEKEVWVKREDGRRSKESRAYLYADQQALTDAMELEAQLNKQIKDAWESCPKWEPKP